MLFIAFSRSSCCANNTLFARSSFSAWEAISSKLFRKFSFSSASSSGVFPLTLIGCWGGVSEV